MDDVTIARAVHVVSVIHWMGGVAFVTAVVLPMVAATAEPLRQIALFEQIEHRFSAQAKISVPLAGLSGFYMVDRLDVWHRFLDPSGWWLAAMAVLWALFMAILFVLEPIVLRGRMRALAATDAPGAVRLLQRAHWLLLLLGTLVAGAGVLGAHGLLG
jgi:uncharacterized membrane protein